MLTSIRGQNIGNVIIDDVYFQSASYEKVFQTLSQKYNLKFHYNTDEVKEYKLSYLFTLTPIETALNIIVRDKSLVYKIDEQGEIHILKRESSKAQVNIKYAGSATKKNYALTGVVKDSQSGETLPFVSISAEGTPIGTASNVDGYFSLLNVPTDTSTLVLSYIGYKKTTYYLNPKTPTQNLIIYMEQEATQLEEVVIKGEREDLLQTNERLSVVKMSPKQLAQLPNLGEKDIMRAFQLMPGISASNEASSGLYVRGGTPDQNLVTYDGFTVYHVDHLFGFFSAFNSNAIKDVQLYKGAFESKFGGRISSVTEITSKDGNENNASFGADVSLLSMNAFAEIPIGNKITTLLALRKSWKSPIYNKIFDQFQEENENSMGAPQGRGRMGNADLQTKVKSYFYDLNSKITFRPTKKDVLAISFYNGTDDLDNSRIMGTPDFLKDKGMSVSNNIIDYTKWGNTGSSLKWSRKWNTKFYSNTLISYSNYFSTRERSTEGKFTNSEGESRGLSRGTFEDNDLIDFSYKTDIQWDAGSNNKFEGGVNATHLDIAYNLSENDTISILDRHNTGSIFSGYLQDNVTLFGNKLKILPGFRYSYYDVTDAFYFEPRLNSEFKLNKRVKFKSGWGDYYQFANRVLREDISSGSRDFWILADDINVPVSKATHYIAGISYETLDYLFDIEGFYKEMDGLSEYSFRIKRDFRQMDYDESFFSGSGTAKGIEFLAQKKFGKLNGWVSYTLSEVMYNFPELSEDLFPASHDATHEFKIVGLYKYKKWDFGATWVYATGKPYTAPEGGYEIDLIDGGTQDFVAFGDKNGLRLPDYHRLDISANYNFQIGERKKTPGRIGLSLFNLYDRKNIWYKEFEILDGEIVETDVSFLGFTPNVSISLKF